MNGKAQKQPNTAIATNVDHALAAAAICSAGKAVLPGNMGCLVLTFDFGDGGHMGYASTGERGDCIKALREFLSNFEGN